MGLNGDAATTLHLLASLIAEAPTAPTPSRRRRPRPRLLLGRDRRPPRRHTSQRLATLRPAHPSQPHTPRPRLTIRRCPSEPDDLTPAERGLRDQNNHRTNTRNGDFYLATSGDHELAVDTGEAEMAFDRGFAVAKSAAGPY
jgi:hypothetical protein